MGRLVYEKGIQHLIAAMPKILNGYHDAKLVICGKGGMEQELRQDTRKRKTFRIENVTGRAEFVPLSSKTYIKSGTLSYDNAAMFSPAVR